MSHAWNNNNYNNNNNDNEKNNNNNKTNNNSNMLTTMIGCWDVFFRVVLFVSSLFQKESHQLHEEATSSL